jgi:hypothetical protein
MTARTVDRDTSASNDCRDLQVKVTKLPFAGNRDDGKASGQHGSITLVFTTESPEPSKFTSNMYLFYTRWFFAGRLAKRATIDQVRQCWRSQKSGCFDENLYPKICHDNSPP